MRQHWAELGWERSRIGYPLGPEQDFVDPDLRIQYFECGAMQYVLRWPDDYDIKAYPCTTVDWAS